MYISNVRKEIVVITLFIALAFLLRLYLLPPLTNQEALVGYRAHSLVETGKDETNRTWPFIFTSSEDILLPIPTYITLPAVALFGPNSISITIAAILISSLGVLPLFVIAKRLLPNNPCAQLWLVTLYVIAPWTIFLSRISSSLLLAFVCSLFAIASFFSFRQNVYKLGLPALFLLLAMLTDKSVWFVYPFFGIGLIAYLLFAKKQHLLKHAVGFTAFVVLIIIAIALLFPSKNMLRRSILEYDVARTKDVSQANAINQARGIALREKDKLGPFFYNKAYLATNFAVDVLRQYHPRLYFAQGDGNVLHGASNFGFFQIVFLPFFIVGIYKVLKGNRQLFLLLFLVTIPAAIYSALAFPTPHQERLLFAFVPFAITTSIGLSQVLNKKVFLIIFLAILAYNTAIIAYDTKRKEPKRSKEYASINQVAQYIKNGNFTGYHSVYISDSYLSDPIPKLLFHLQYSPKKLHETLGNNQGLIYRHFIKSVGTIQVANTDEITKKHTTVNPLTQRKTFTNKVLLFVNKDELPQFPCYNEITQLSDPRTNEKIYIVIEPCVESI